jgi:hypothetical protein
LFSGLLHAQVDPPPEADTLEMKIRPIEEEEEQSEEESEEEEGETYFVPVWEEGGGIDSPYFRKLGDSILNAAQKDDDFWYANTEFKKGDAGKERRELEGRTSFFHSRNFQTLLWVVVIVGFSAFLGIYLANSNVRLFRKSKTIAGTENENTDTDDIFAISYQKEIDKAVNTGNYRLAVRLLFLQLLRDLSGKNIIQYQQDRTNFDYLMQVSHAPWYPVFFRLTRHYEYVWYGKFEIDNGQFNKIKMEFTQLGQQLPQD